MEVAILSSLGMAILCTDRQLCGRRCFDVAPESGPGPGGRGLAPGAAAEATCLFQCLLPFEASSPLIRSGRSCPLRRPRYVPQPW